MKRGLYIVILVLFSACGSFLEDYSQHLVVPKNVSDMDELMIGSVYIPSEEIEELHKGSEAWFLHIVDDDINTVISRVAERSFVLDQNYFGYTTWQRDVSRNYYDSGNTADNKTWLQLYQRINVINVILNEIDDVNQSNEQDRLDIARIKGECHFLRAQFYLMLVNLYAEAYDPATAATTLGVPVKLSANIVHDKDKNAQFERLPVAEVYAQIVKDLKESVSFFEKSPQTRSYYRASGEAALLLLSRVYLYMQEWELARGAAETMLEKNSKLLNYNSYESSGVVLSETNPEILFSQGSLNLQNVFTAVGGDFCISGDLYNLYEDDDYRKSAFFSRALTDSIALSRKYTKGVHRSYVGDIFMLRVSEGYLNMAEACAMSGDETAALLWLNRFRNYRIKEYTDKSYSGVELINEIRDERRKELCMEGHRWFDLRRYAVSAKYPMKKEIARMYSVYNYDSNNVFIRGEVYVLEVDDPNYVFSIPSSVLDFDTGMTDNIRVNRELVETVVLKSEK